MHSESTTPTGERAGAAGRDPGTLKLIIRAAPTITDTKLVTTRAPFTGSRRQIADDIAQARDIGTHELITDRQAHATHPDQLVDTADTTPTGGSCGSDPPRPSPAAGARSRTARVGAQPVTFSERWLLLVCGEQSGHISYSFWRKKLLAAHAASGVTYTAHDLRHVAVCLHCAGATSRVIQEFVGHESIRTTERTHKHLFKAGPDRARRPDRRPAWTS